MGPSKSGDKYILLLRHDHSDYKWFFICANTMAKTAADAIMDWCASFTVPNRVISDGTIHFKNETVRLVTKGLKVPYHFTLPYNPWSSSAVERFVKYALKTFRSVLSELQHCPSEWPNLVPMLQSMLKNSPSPTLINSCPITAFFGLDPKPPVSSFIRSSTGSPITVSEVIRERTTNIANLKKFVAELHPVVQDTVRNNRETLQAAMSKGELSRFMKADFGLVALEDFKAGENRALRWHGPRRIEKATSDYFYQVEDLRNGQLEDVHISRLRFFRDSALDTQAIISHVSSKTGMPVSRLMELVDDPDGLHVRVR